MNSSEAVGVSLTPHPRSCGRDPNPRLPRIFSFINNVLPLSSLFDIQISESHIFLLVNILEYQRAQLCMELPHTNIQMFFLLTYYKGLYSILCFLRSPLGGIYSSSFTQQSYILTYNLRAASAMSLSIWDQTIPPFSKLW